MEPVGQILKINRERKNLILSDVSKELKISEEILYNIENGYLQNDIFEAEEVLAKHDENYMPPNIEINNDS